MPSRTGWVGADDGLLAWDRNGDGRISEGNELSWTSLNVWKDANGDGYSSEGELLGLDEVGVQSIELDYYRTTGCIKVSFNLYPGDTYNEYLSRLRDRGWVASCCRNPI